MIDSNLIWRSVPLISESMSAPPAARTSDPDNGRPGANLGAEFEAHVLEVAEAREQTATPAIQDYRQQAYSQDQDDQKTTSDEQNGSASNALHTADGAVGLPSDKGNGSVSSADEFGGDSYGSVVNNDGPNLRFQYRAGLSGNSFSMRTAVGEGASRGRSGKADGSGDLSLQSDITQVQGFVSPNKDGGRTSAQLQGVSTTRLGRGRSASAAFSGGGKPDFATAATNYRDEVDVAATAANNRPDDAMETSRNDISDLFGIDRFALSMGNAEDIVSTGSAGSPSVKVAQSARTSSDLMSADRIRAGSGEMHELSARAPTARAWGNGTVSSADTRSEEQSDVVVAKAGLSNRQGLNVSAGSGSASRAAESAVPWAAGQTADGPEESVPNGGTPYVIDRKSPTSHERGAPPKRATVTGQSRSFLPPVTSFQMEQIGRPGSTRGQLASETLRGIGKSNSSAASGGDLAGEAASTGASSVSVGIAAALGWKAGAESPAWAPELATKEFSDLDDVAKVNNRQSTRSDMNVTGWSGRSSVSFTEPVVHSDHQPLEQLPEWMPKVGSALTRRMKGQGSNETGRQTIGVSVAGSSGRFAPTAASPLQQIARLIPGPGRSDSSAGVSADESDASMIAPGRREEHYAPVVSATVPSGAIAEQAGNSVIGPLAANWSSAADSDTRDVVRAESSDRYSADVQPLASSADSNMTNDRMSAASEAALAVSESGVAAIASVSGEPTAVNSQAPLRGDGATVKDSASLRPVQLESAGSRAAMASPEKPVLRPDVRSPEEQPESVPSEGTSHVSDATPPISNTGDMQTVGVSVIGQSRSFAPPSMSFDMQQIAHPIIAACQTAEPGSATEGTGTGLSASALVKTLEIRLDPASLGAVMVKMRLSGDALEIQVAADHQETLSLLRDNKDALSQSLQSSGYKLDAITLQGSAGAGGSELGQDSARQGHRFEPQSSPQESFLGSSQQGEHRPRDQSRLERGSEASSGETLGSQAQDSGPDRRSGAIYV